MAKKNRQRRRLRAGPTACFVCPPRRCTPRRSTPSCRPTSTRSRPDGGCRPGPCYTYICGGKAGKREITPKYIGHSRLVEIAIATLVTDRALLLIGEPGTAKSWLSEHLAAAINGDSTKVVQGTAGTTEEQIRYTWNYAMLIAHGPSPRP